MKATRLQSSYHNHDRLEPKKQGAELKQALTMKSAKSSAAELSRAGKAWKDGDAASSWIL